MFFEKNSNERLILAFNENMQWYFEVLNKWLCYCYPIPKYWHFFCILRALCSYMTLNFFSVYITSLLKSSSNFYLLWKRNIVLLKICEYLSKTCYRDLRNSYVLNSRLMTPLKFILYFILIGRGCFIVIGRR